MGFIWNNQRINWSRSSEELLHRWCRPCDEGLRGSLEWCRLPMFVTTTESDHLIWQQKLFTTFPFFSASSFSHLSYAVSQALLVTSHPLPRGPTAPSVCDLIQNHYCTPHLSEVYTQPPPRAPETPLPPPSGLLALEKRTITQHWLVLLFLLQSHGAWVHTGRIFLTFDTKPSA